MKRRRALWKNFRIYRKITMRIIVFWDSISEWFWDYENGWWVNRLKIDFWKKYWYEKMVFNGGISAYTSKNILNYFEPFFNAVCKREIWKEKQTTIIFAIWINDSAEDTVTKEKRVTISKFEKNIETLIALCKKEELIQKVLFLSATNVEEDVINRKDSSWAEYYFYNNDIQKYNQLIKTLAEKNEYAYVDIFGLMQDWDLDDGLHPNSQWHQKIYEKVLEHLEK